jgi:hypothetical protein
MVATSPNQQMQMQNQQMMGNQKEMTLPSIDFNNYSGEMPGRFTALLSDNQQYDDTLMDDIIKDDIFLSDATKLG